MIRIKIFFFFTFLLAGLGAFSQTITESIYHELDSFIESKPNESSLQRLGGRALYYTKRVEDKEEKLALVILQCNMAFYHKYFGNHTQAINLYEDASQSYKEDQLAGYNIIEYCLKPLGNLYTIRGDFTNAENTIKQYIFMAEQQKDEQQKVAGIINLSVVYHNTGNYNLAIKILRKAIKNSEPGAEKKELLENNLTSNLIALNKTKEAQVMLSLHQAGKNNSVQDYKNAAQMAFRDQDFEQALNYLDKAKNKLLTKQDFTAREIAKLYVEQSEVYIANEQYTKAYSVLQTGLSILLPSIEEDNQSLEHSLYPENTLLDIFDGLAYLATDFRQALEYYDLSFHVSHLLQQQIHSQEAKIINQVDNRRRSEKCLDLIYHQYHLNGEKEMLQMAFNYAENSKAMVLKGALTRKSLLKEFPKDSLLLLEKNLASKQEETINLMVRKQLTNSSEESIQNVISELVQINRALKEVREKIDIKFAEAQITSFSLKQIQEKLGDDEAEMSLYFYGKAHIYQFIISDSKLELHQILLTEELKQTIQDFISFFDSPSVINDHIIDFKTTAFQLYKKLQLDLCKKDGNLLIIPDGVLGFVPFEALLTQATTSNIYKEMPFLLKDLKVFYNTSATFYMDTHARKKGKSMLGFFPVFKGSQRMLKYSLDEADMMRDYPKAKVFTGEEATKANFLKEMNKFEVLHLSTHASGGNFVVPANIEFADDVMLVHELYALSINPYLVILSACETGVGKLQKGEGAMSIARAFQYAGAQNLLFSLWQVNDYSTARLMQEFYRNYDKNQSALVANQQSKWQYLEDDKIANPKKSPYYWSAFVYYGVPEVAQPQLEVFYISLVIIMLIILVLVRKYKP